MIASRGFLFACNHHIDNPESESRTLPLTFPQAGESVYVHPTALTNFIQFYLPNIKHPFILVSGDSDTTVPDDVRHEAITILTHPLLICWYSQNCTEPSEKLKQLPIGLDFHTLERGNYYWGKRQTIASQIADINYLLTIGGVKQNKCYANFHFLTTTRYGNDRIDAIKKIPRHLVFYEPRTLKRVLSWRNMINYKYVISPHGNGLDCHRTWEALILGCIPIVKTSPLDTLFSGLPVLIVKDWSDITQTLLDTFVPDTSHMEKLLLSYWLSLINVVPK